MPPCSCYVHDIIYVRISTFSLTGRDALYITIHLTVQCSVPVCLFVCIYLSVRASVHPQITPSLSTVLGERVLSENVLGGTSHVRVLAFGGEKCPGRGRIAKWKHPQVGI